MDTLHDLVRIGAIQFGQFALPLEPGNFAPIHFNLGLVPSYPAVLRDLTLEIAELIPDGYDRLLAMPDMIPLGTAVSLQRDLPLVYPSPLDLDFVEGAYDYNVSTVLLTGIFSDGFAERALIKRVKSAGLDVKIVVAVFDLGDNSSIAGNLPLNRWRQAMDVLKEIDTLTPSMRTEIERWLMSRRL